MKKIEIKKVFNIECKRMHIPFSVKHKCECGEELEQDLEDDYISYPTINGDEYIIFYCNECDSEYRLPIKLSMSIEYDIKEIHKI